MKKISFIITVIFLTACSNNTIHNNSADTSSAIANNESKSLQVDDADKNLQTDTTNITTNNTNSDKMIVPGERIGEAVLNSDADSIEKLFGKPDMSDAAMGKAWITWYGKKRDEHNNKTELNIYTAYRDTSMREKSVQQVRTTSSYFNTENGIHVYSSLEEIRKAFPQVTKVQQSKEDARKFTVFDDVRNGIAFEIVDANNQKICTAIFIHLKNKKVRDIYIPYQRQ